MLDTISQRPSLPDGHVISPACLPILSAGCLAQYANTRRIFSFPGQLKKQQYRQSDDASGYLYLYLTPRLQRPSGLTGDLKDAIVLIGNSTDETDQHDTAVGRMSGAELQLNDIRQFALTPPIGHVAVWRMIWDERAFYVAGFIVSLIVYSLGHRLIERRQALRPRAVECSMPRC